MRKVQFNNGDFYHVYNRGVDKRATFIDEKNKQRFLKSLKLSRFNKDGDELVEIHAYCLMDNHYHLLVRQVCDKGISDFMHAVGTGYTNYFNLSYDRSGCLFEGPYKARSVDSDAYLWHLFRYIHLNPLDKFDKRWRVSGVKNIAKALDFVNEYRWSSLSTSFIKKQTFTKNNMLQSEFGNFFDYKGFLTDWICFGTPPKLGFLGA